jgi:hypothetical protein
VYQVSADSPSCLMANRQSEVFDAPSVASTCAFAAPSTLFRRVAFASQSKAFLANVVPWKLTANTGSAFFPTFL